MEMQTYEMFREFPDVISIDDLMKMLHIGKSLAYRSIRNGTIPAKKLGRGFIIAKLDVIEYVIKQSA